jgi:polyhydroxybutyrate depolymerase
LTIIEQGGHTWPGGASLPGFLVGETTQDISASALLWDFYQAHPLADSE